MDLKNKTILITGASRGIGRVTVEYLAQRGGTVIIHFNNDETAANSLLKSLPGAGHSIFQADFSQSNDFETIIGALMKKYGKIDALINNAGIYIEKKIGEFDIEEWRRVWQKTISINLSSVADLCFVMSNYMKSGGGGKIINISSRGAFRGEPDALAYGASKAGLNSFGQSLAQALAPYNICVYTIAPGFVETDMASEALDGPNGESIKSQSPLKRAAKPVEISRVIGFLLSEENEYLTGSIIDVNGASYLR